MTGLLNNSNNFIKKSINKFGNKFEYLGEYTSAHNFIQIKCKKHNTVFEVSARNHLRSETGSCPRCKTINMKNIKAIDQDYFINRSKSIFGNKFNYSKINYTNKKGKIILICDTHSNEFEIEPKSHYYSKSGGCIDCKNEMKNKELLNQIISKYNDKFDFSKIDLKLTKNTMQLIKCNTCNNHIKICIVKFDGICIKCIKNDIRNKNIINQKLLNVGNKIKNTILMRLNFNSDEYVKKINIEGLGYYFVSNYGKIFNSYKKRLYGHTNLQGYVFVRLLCNGKNTLFRLHRLVCTTFNGIPTKNQNFVDHINRIRNDNKANNLRWVTHSENMKNKSNIKITKNKKLVINNYIKLNKNDEEFKIILNSLYGNFINFSISNYGRIKNNTSNKIIRPTVTDEGYLNISLKSDENNHKSITVHRIVCEFFNKKYNANDIVVNHINKIKYDNYYENLEWVTVAKNNQHSKNKSINMLDNNKNIIQTFASFTDAYKYLGKEYSNTIHQQIKKGRKSYGYYWSLN